MPSIQAGVVTMDMQWFVGILLGVIGIGGTAFGFLLKYALDLHKEQAALKAQVSSLEDRNSILKENSKDEVTALKVENLELQRVVKEKYSDDAVLAKYEIKSDMGLAVHKQSKISYCLGCLTGLPKREVPLIDNGNYWICSVEKMRYPFQKCRVQI